MAFMRCYRWGALALAATLVPAVALAQTTAPPGPVGAYQGPTPPSKPVVERVGPDQWRVGTIRVDTGRREISVAGTVNPGVMTLEFVANTRAGIKAYESAVTLDTDAITFNTALVLIGLDPARARNAPRAHFDPATPEGDPVEITIECPGGECQRLPAERLLYDQDTKQEAASDARWVYIGSKFLPDGRYLAHLDGVLVSFVHTPAAVIELARGVGLNRYGSIGLNPNLGLSAGTAVMMTIKAAGAPGSR